jgi:hypothetical protein
MTSFRQIEANRRNALKSTGPRTEAGKQASRGNAVRHGLTAETVIGALEDAGDYRAFEEAITADYDAQSAVERELVLRLASLLWRLRRAGKIETGLFEIQGKHLMELKGDRKIHPNFERIVGGLLGRVELVDLAQNPASDDFNEESAELLASPAKSAHPEMTAARNLAHCFLRPANLPNYALDRLSRYEATLWRQVAQTLFALDALDRRKPQERRLRLPLERGTSVY